MMNSTQEDAVLDFDLDFLHPATANVPVQLLKQKYITQLKRRIIRVDALQHHRNSINQELNSKSKELEDTKKKLEVTTQEYTRTSLEYKEALESSTKWEKETQRLNIIIKRLEDERIKAVNELQAIRSHAVQLEQLVKQQERKIDGLDRYDTKNVDKLIARKVGAVTKEKEEEILVWKRKYEILRRRLQDKKSEKSSKELSQKSDNVGNDSCILSDEHSDSEDNTIPFSKRNIPRNNAGSTQRCPIPAKDSIRMETDTDCSHEVDTGCGSSLSSSDNEKWLNSPDFVFSPINVEPVVKSVNTATSPIPSKMVATASSPIPLVKTFDVGTSTKLAGHSVDVATSPITIQIETLGSSECQSDPRIVERSEDEDKHHDTRQANINAVGSTIERSQNEDKYYDTRQVNRNALGTSFVNSADLEEHPSTKQANKNEVVSDYNLLPVRIEKLRDKLCSDGKINADTKIDIASTRSKETLHMETDNIYEEESPEYNIDEDYVMDDGTDLIELRDLGIITQEAECLDNGMNDANIFDDEICYGALKNFDKLPCVQIESGRGKECSENKMDVPHIFDDEIGTISVKKALDNTPCIMTENMQKPSRLDSQVSEDHRNCKHLEKVQVPEFVQKQIGEDLNVSYQKASTKDKGLEEIPCIEVKTIQPNESGKELEKLQVSEFAGQKIVEDFTVNHHKPSTTAEGLKEIPCVELTNVQPKESYKELQKLLVTEFAGQQIGEDLITNNQKPAVTGKALDEIPCVDVKNVQLNKSADNKMEEDCVIENDPNDSKYYENKRCTRLQEIKEKVCLELNNSSKMNADQSTDNEIEMILKTMRIRHKLITPIPLSPKTSCCVPSTMRGCGTQTTVVGHSCPEAVIAQEHAATAKEEAASAKEDAAKAREENKKLMATLNSLMKDMFNIKHFLKNRLAMPENLPDQNNDSQSQTSFNLFNDDVSNDVGFAENIDSVHADKPLANLERASDTKIKILSDEIIKPADSHDSTESRKHKIEKTVEHQSLCNENNVTYSESKSDKSCKDAVNEVVKLETKDKKGKKRKLTNLDKYRQKCELRKYKIKSETPPLTKPHLKPKEIHSTKQVTDFDSSATLNNTEVYAKAVKVMAELNSKRHKSSTESLTKAKSQHKSNVIEDNSTENKCSQNIIGMTPVTSPQPSDVKTVPVAPVIYYPTRSSKCSTKLQDTIVTSQTTGITSPRQSITSPVGSPKPTITSPRRSTKSQEMTVTSSTPANRTLRSSIRSPELVAVSAKSTITSPTRHIKSPDLGIVSPRPVVALPRLSIRSPDIPPLSPKAVIMSARSSFTASVPSITSPEAKITYQKLASASSNKLPETDVTSKLAARTYAIRSSKAGITSPQFTPIPAKTPLSPRLAGTSFNTRSHSKNDITGDCFVMLNNDSEILEEMPLSVYSNINRNSKENQVNHEVIDVPVTRKRTISNSSDSQGPRVLRTKKSKHSEETRTQIVYELDELEEMEISTTQPSKEEHSSTLFPKDSILCTMIRKYGVKTMKPYSRNVDGSILANIKNSIETCVTKVKESTSNKHRGYMNELVEALIKYPTKDFVAGLIHYLSEPERKLDLVVRDTWHPAPPLPKYEQILLYVLNAISAKTKTPDTIPYILTVIKNTLFKINRTPDFSTIEVLSHFYAALCRYTCHKRDVAMFMLDAMYCLVFKSIPLVKQCLDVWPRVIPLAHMNLANTPLVMCFVYLLHFYKCEDRYNRVQDIRNLLNRQYFYEISEWNETRILALFNNAITELQDTEIQKKMLRIALLIFGKRHDPMWAHINIVRKMLVPNISNENNPEHVKEFCVSMLGPFMKPYPHDMKPDCVLIMNQLTDILNKTTSPKMAEAALSSFIVMSRHNCNQVIEILLSREMRSMSPELEDLLRSFVRLKPIHGWVKCLKNFDSGKQSQPCD